MSEKLKREGRRILTGGIVFFMLILLDAAGVRFALWNNALLRFILFVIPYLIIGSDVVKKAVLGIKNRQPFDESFLMTVATIGAFVTGENAEACAVMLFYQVGEWFQGYAVGKSRKNISALMDIAPEKAFREAADGELACIDPDDVEIGDTLVVKPGERIPVDGTVLSGDSMMNTSALTGESRPRHVSIGSQVISGCVNGEGLLRIRADKIYEDSAVARILELVENATDKKSRVENFITRFARVYTPIVVGAALLLAIVPALLTGDPLKWIYRACTFLVISCPCALVISIPLSFFGGIGAASANGVLVKGSNYLELLGKIDTIVTDKTGTLSKGDFEVTAVYPEEGYQAEAVLYYAAIAEHGSSHPIAGAILRKSRAIGSEIKDAAVNIRNIAGQGILAETDGKMLLVGNAKLMESAEITVPVREESAATVCYVAYDGRYLGMIHIQDEIKPEAADALREMKRAGIRKTVMLTGDSRTVGEAVGKTLGLDQVFSELLPQDKVSIVEKLMREAGSYGKVAFVGDGINDAPVLARADVGIAMGSLGSDAAIEAADVVIMDDDLTRIAKVIGIARRTTRIAEENIICALTVKLLVLLLGASGFAGMWAAVFADVGVAMLCILNAMRLLGEKRTIGIN